ncbi:MAG: hypothetical protein P1U39_06470 [Legionellaceae bacterium]|nr:hypothetical protein [Legionellaceae bacterium]
MYIKQAFVAMLLGLPMLAHAAHMDDVRGARYCEVVVSEGRLTLAVYNTMGLNQCPETQWKKITPKILKKNMKTRIAILNGPRYWTTDAIDSTPLAKTAKKSIKGLSMKKVALVHIKLKDIVKGHKPYNQHHVDRNVVWTYKAGKPVYELIDPAGRVYVMQSYSLDKAAQTPRSLAQLGKKLKLPAGWHYRTGVLRQETKLPSMNKQAIIIQDDFLNTYQLAAHDFLK